MLIEFLFIFFSHGVVIATDMLPVLEPCGVIWMIYIPVEGKELLCRVKLLEALEVDATVLPFGSMSATDTPLTVLLLH
jgi:hypothetical protein